jgi:hypothetical protein
MHYLAMDALLLRIRCCDMCLSVCYLAMDALLLLDVGWNMFTAQSVIIRKQKMH